MSKDDDLDKELPAAPNERYKEFFAKFQEIDTLEIEKWRAVHLIAYFCKLYQDVFGVSYQFKFNTPAPSKCIEVFRINSLALKLSAKPQILKNYIDWVFQEKVKKSKSKRPFGSISFVADDQAINFYKLNVLLAKKPAKLDRSTPLPSNYQELILVRYPEVGDITTYGDLAFADQAYDGEERWDTLMIELEALGLDCSILDEVV